MRGTGSGVLWVAGAAGGRQKAWGERNQVVWQSVVVVVASVSSGEWRSRPNPNVLSTPGVNQTFRKNTVRCFHPAMREAPGVVRGRLVPVQEEACRISPPMHYILPW